VLVDVHVPSKLTSRQRDLLEQLAVELGEVDEPEEADAEPGDGGTGDGSASKSGRKRKRRSSRAPGIRDRLRDAIS
jgi:hypothetical protein